jgi:hypothetical protein
VDSSAKYKRKNRIGNPEDSMTRDPESCNKNWKKRNSEKNEQENNAVNESCPTANRSKA